MALPRKRPLIPYSTPHCVAQQRSFSGGGPCVCVCVCVFGGGVFALPLECNKKICAQPGSSDMGR